MLDTLHVTGTLKTVFQSWETLLMVHYCICSLKSMFDSLQFKENLSSFQLLLAEGIFDFSFSGVKFEECKTLKRLALSNIMTSTWVEHYHFLKVWIVFLTWEYCYMKMFTIILFLKSNFFCYFCVQKRKNGTGGSVVVKGQNIITSNSVVNLKRSRDSQSKKFPG